MTNEMSESDDYKQSKGYLLTYGVDTGQDHQHVHTVLVYANNETEAIKKVKNKFPDAVWVENNTIE